MNKQTLRIKFKLRPFKVRTTLSNLRARQRLNPKSAGREILQGGNQNQDSGYTDAELL